MPICKCGKNLKCINASHLNSMRHRELMKRVSSKSGGNKIVPGMSSGRPERLWSLKEVWEGKSLESYKRNYG